MQRYKDEYRYRTMNYFEIRIRYSYSTYGFSDLASLDRRKKDAVKWSVHLADFQLVGL